MVTSKSQQLANIKADVKIIDDKLHSISRLQRHIGTYGKTKDIYKQYKQSKARKQFLAENSLAIYEHESAKQYFNERGYGYSSGNKLPTIKELREEYAKHNAQKKILWANYHEVRTSNVEADNAWQNVSAILNLKKDEKEQIKSETKDAPSL